MSPTEMPKRDVMNDVEDVRLQSRVVSDISGSHMALLSTLELSTPYSVSTSAVRTQYDVQICRQISSDGNDNCLHGCICQQTV